MLGHAYDTELLSHGPILIGVTGDTCGLCSSNTVPLYKLSCHNANAFYCRDCLTKAWHSADDSSVPCPTCNNDCGFLPLQSIEELAGINNEFLEVVGFDKIRKQPEVMNNLISFTAAEAATLLDNVYFYFDDQILNTVELGGIPSYLSNNTQELLATNLYHTTLKSELTSVPKMMTTPLELEEDLMGVLNNTLVQDTKLRYHNVLDMNDVDLENDSAVLSEATSTFEDMNTIRENWIGIIKMWVDLLAWRHLERTASV